MRKSGDCGVRAAWLADELNEMAARCRQSASPWPREGHFRGRFSGRGRRSGVHGDVLFRIMNRLPCRLPQYLAPAIALAIGLGALMAAPQAAVPPAVAGEPAIARCPGAVDPASSPALAARKPLFL